jgi:phage baseplate assembly protein W
VKKISGFQKLVQQVVKLLLTNAGSNKYNLAEGGDLVRVIGSSLAPSARSRISTAITQAVTTTEEQIVATQAGIRGLPSSERLLSLVFTGVLFDETAGEARATIRVNTFAGRSVTVPLTL